MCYTQYCYLRFSPYLVKLLPILVSHLYLFPLMLAHKHSTICQLSVEICLTGTFGELLIVTVHTLHA